MKPLKMIIIFLSVIFLLISVFNFLIVLPEYCACRNAAENEAVEIYRTTYDCIGDSAEFSLVFFKMICLVLAVLLLIIVTLVIIYRKEKGKSSTQIRR